MTAPDVDQGEDVEADDDRFRCVCLGCGPSPLSIAEIEDVVRARGGDPTMAAAVLRCDFAATQEDRLCNTCRRNVARKGEVAGTADSSTSATGAER